MSANEPEYWEKVIALRHRLHANPELSGSETATAAMLVDWLQKHNPDQLHRGVAGAGLVAVFDSGKPGDTVLFRAELDALPIPEGGSLPYRSTVAEVAHLCGHDGHMAILAAMAERLGSARPACGRVALLFQPAEETGEGAAAVVADPVFAGLKADWVFALHNLPGSALGEVIVRSGPFAFGSAGFIATLEGRTAHAAHPEQGRSPARALSRLIERLDDLSSTMPADAPPSLSTVIHARLGEIAFGTTPGTATIMATFRAETDEALATLRRAAERAVAEEAAAEGLRWQTSLGDTFPATHNHPRAVEVVRVAAAEVGLSMSEPAEPMRWSEDFGWYSHRARAALIGLGAGVSQAALHAAEYDFPDSLLEPGVRLLEAIARRILGGAAQESCSQDIARVVVS